MCHRQTHDGLCIALENSCTCQPEHICSFYNVSSKDSAAADRQEKEEQTCCKLRLFMSFRGLLPTLFSRPRPDPLRFRIRGLGPRVGTPP